jgi:hypothetical protein
MSEVAAAILTGGWGGLVVKKAKKQMDKQPDVPTPDEPAVAEARREREEGVRRKKGRGASILTGGAGLTTEPALGRPSLLGPS